MSPQDTDIPASAARNVTAFDPLAVLDDLLPDAGLSRAETGAPCRSPGRIPSCPPRTVSVPAGHPDHSGRPLGHGSRDLSTSDRKVAPLPGVPPDAAKVAAAIQRRDAFELDGRGREFRRPSGMRNTRATGRAGAPARSPAGKPARDRPWSTSATHRHGIPARPSGRSTASAYCRSPRPSRPGRGPDPVPARADVLCATLRTPTNTTAQRCCRGPIGVLARPRGSGGSCRGAPRRVHGLEGRCPPGR